MVQQNTPMGVPQQQPAGVVAVEQTEQIVAPVRATLVEPYPPSPSVMLGQDPRPYWNGGPGIGVILAILIAVLGAAVLIFVFVARGNQTTATVPLAPIPTSAAVQAPAPQAPALAPPPAAVAPVVPVAPALQAAAPQPAAPAAVAPAPAIAAPPAAAAAPVAVAPAPSSDTSAGTILFTGETWRQNGLDLTLSSPQFSANGFTANFSLRNRGQNDTRFQFTKGSAFSAIDNRDASIALSDQSYRYDFVLQPNATVLLDVSHAGGAISFTGPISSQASSITVTVKGVGDITNAQWRIPVQR